jgi:putative FmdB family regulatory protein
LPLYEYECQKCGANFEKIQKFSDPPLTTCERCGGRLEKLLSPPAIQFKGTGWYVTDYARKSSEGSKGQKASATSEDKGKSATTQETPKPAEAPAKKDS